MIPRYKSHLQQLFKIPSVESQVAKHCYDMAQWVNDIMTERATFVAHFIMCCVTHVKEPSALIENKGGKPDGPDRESNRGHFGERRALYAL